MSDSPLLSKMDALLKKHRGGGAPETPVQAPPDVAENGPPHAWLPVLTQVIERGMPPSPAQPAEPARRAAALPCVDPPAEEAGALPTVVTDTLAEQLMSELAPRLSEVMEKKVAAELRKNIDQTVSTLLGQLDVNVREIVRDAVAEKLRRPDDSSN